MRYRTKKAYNIPGKYVGLARTEREEVKNYLKNKLSIIVGHICRNDIK